MKNKKIAKIVFGVLVVLICGVLIFINSNRVIFKDKDAIVMQFIHGEKNITHQLTDEENKKIIDILNNKNLINKFVMGELSCGFSDNVCFFTNDEIFEVASDGCPYIFAVNSNKYIAVSYTHLRAHET